MAYLTLGLLFLGAVSAAPSRHRRETGIQCPAANGTIVQNGGQSWSIECGIDTWRGDMPSPNGQHVATMDDCIKACVDRTGCQSVAWLNKDACYLKGSIPSRLAKADVWGAVLVAADVKSTSTVTNTATVTVVGSGAQIAAPTPVVAVVDKGTSPNTPKASSAAAAPVASVAPVASAVPVTAPTSGGRPAAKSLSTKRGVPYNSASLVSPFSGAISWAYNWGQTADGSLPSGVEYVPMLWGSKMYSGWNANAQSAISAGASVLLGFNEPDHDGQAHMDVGSAVSGWKQYMEPFASKARLGAPAVTNGGAPMGLAWLTSFLSACSDCTIDLVPIHWYDSASNIEYFKSYVQQAYAAGGNRPLWITEFGATGSDAQIATFFSTVIPWLDSQPYVERYSYFFAADGYLTSGNSLSAIGKAYISA